MKVKDKIKSDTQTTSGPAIIGTFTGECADANITNKNGLDITREVFENVFASEEYHTGIELGHYVGFLGHPEDVNCMDFRNACIVMTEGHIDDDGKVYGSFNLIDTPVGRIVKTFIDAGVQWGISIRGAGDIINNSVDPETFVFRGFDLVAFPAYPEAIPTFQAIAASSDTEKQARYKSVCKAVKDNMKDITSAATIDVLKDQFAPQSEEYAALSDRQGEILDECSIDEHDNPTVPPIDTTCDLSADKVEALSMLFADKVAECEALRAEIATLRTQLDSSTVAASRRLRSMKRISASQLSDLESMNDSLTKKVKDAQIKASKQNLKYTSTIDKLQEDNSKQSKVIASLNTRIDETVKENERLKQRASNLEASNSKLQDDIKASQSIIDEYQDSYAAFYAHAIGASLDNVKVTANTRVDELKQMITSSSASNMSTTTVLPQPEDIDIYSDDEGDDVLITM